MMNSFRSIFVSTLCAMALLTAPSFVAGPTVVQAQQLPAQVPLSPELVEGFIGSYPRLEALGEVLEQKYGQMDADPEDPSSIVSGFAKYADARAQMESIVRDYGFSSLQDWIQVAYSVMLAYSFSERGEGGGSVDSEMAEAIDQIKSDRNIPDNQKEQLIAMLQQQMEQISQLRPPAGNIEIIQQYAEQLRPIAESQ